jgi:D-arginine dehydrogenase
LATRSNHEVILIESERVPGHHSSGRNASMARRVIGDPIMSALATEGVTLIRQMEASARTALLTRTGGLLIGKPADVAQLHRWATEVDGLAQDMVLVDADELPQRVKALEGCHAQAGIATSECGVVDIHALLSLFLKLARDQGADLRFGHRLEEIGVKSGRICRAKVNGSWLECETIVNAAGFGANSVAEMAHLAPLPLTPARRHLYVTQPWGKIDPDWPFVWDISHGLYFRPEGGGLLMCACDETAWSEAAVTVDGRMRLRLAEKFSTYVPGLRGARPAHEWAGLRVLTPDGRFVIGRDPRLDGLVWVAGLGGHGMTTSAAVGALAARAISEETLGGGFERAFDPGRFLGSAPN